MAHGSAHDKGRGPIDLRAALTALLLAVFVGLSYDGALGKSPTYDEPLHVLSTWVYRYAGDFSIVCDHPPLWVFWASLPMRRSDLRVDTSSAEWRRNTDQMWTENTFAFDALYRDAAVNADRLVQRARAMMVLLGGVLGILLALWAWRLGGPSAGLITAAFFAFDPSFLGNAPLVKNDVAAALVTVALMYAVWRLGRRATGWNLGATALLCGAAVNTKFSLLQCGPIVAALLIGRALLGDPWIVFDRPLGTRRARCTVAAGMLILMLATSAACTWGLYRFRFGPTDDPAVTLNTDGYLNDVRLRSIMVQHPTRLPTPEELAEWTPPESIRAILWLISHHALPSAWLHGILFVYSHAIARSSYLLGQVRIRSPWYFVPFELLVKTPVATLAALLLAFAAGIVLLRRHGPIETGSAWCLACVVLPPAVFLASASASSLGIGLRHVLPAWAFVFIAIGVVGARAISTWGRPAVAAVLVLSLGTAAETAHAYPDYIAFFNLPAGGERGGLRLLGDSNLDWGQDLPDLAAWQRAHGVRPLYLAYSGFAEPGSYGIRYQKLSGPPVHAPSGQAAYVAISATTLQGIYLTGEVQRYFHRYLALRPIAVLGGTIYVYDRLLP